MPVYSSCPFPTHLRDSEILIVGAGAVGLALAVDLARNGRAVTVLEGGPPIPPTDFRTANWGPSTGHPHAGLIAGRMKALGGTTALWGGQLVPFDRGDLEAKDADGHPLWPIGYDDFAPWVERAYALLGVDEAGRATRTLWEKATGASADFGHGLTAHMNIWMKQPDFTRFFANEIGTLAGLKIVTDAEVIDLAFAADGRVEHVVVQSKGGGRETLSAREVILANGTMEISRLLLRTAAIAPYCPYAANRHIGRWYLDHLHGLIGDLHDADVPALRRMFDNVYFQNRKYNVKLRLAPGPERGRVNMAATLNPRLTPGHIVGEAIGLARRMFRGKGGLSGFGQGLRMAVIMAPLVWRYLVRRRSTSLFASGTAIGVEVEQLPNDACRLMLDPAQPPEIAPIGVHWAFEGSEIAAIGDMAARIKAAFEEHGLGRVAIDPRIVARDPSFLSDFVDGSHQMGGARMAVTADEGVTDRHGHVFGSPNLSIAGAAVFPSGSFANCTLSAIALALRTGDHVAARLVDKRSLRTNGMMDRIVFGCGRLTGGATEKSSLALLKQAFDAGIRAVDVAPSYGMGLAEQVVGKAVKYAADAGIDIKVYAKLGSERDPNGWAKSWLRLIKRRLRPTPPRSMAHYRPQSPPVTHPHSLEGFDPDALRASFAIARARLGRIDALLMHEARPGDLGARQQDALATMAKESGARPGYSVSWVWSAEEHRAYPDDFLAETALDPGALIGGMPPPPAGAILHSIVPAMDFLLRTEPHFADALSKAASMIPNGSEQSRRIAAFYGLVAQRLPEASLIYASSDRSRLGEFLHAVQAIDAQGIGPSIADCFVTRRVGASSRATDSIDRSELGRAILP